MLNFLIQPFAEVFYNDDQMVFCPDGLTNDPEWTELSIRYDKRHDHFEVLFNDRIVFCIGDVNLLISILKSTEFYIGWLQNNQLESRRINFDFSQLLNK